MVMDHPFVTSHQSSPSAESSVPTATTITTKEEAASTTTTTTTTVSASAAPFTVITPPGEQEVFVEMNSQYYYSMLMKHHQSMTTAATAVVDHDVMMDMTQDDDDEENEEYFECVIHDPYMNQIIQMYKDAFLSNGQDESSVADILSNFVIHSNYKCFALLTSPTTTNSTTNTTTNSTTNTTTTANQPQEHMVAAFAIVSMLNDNESFCHLDYISVSEQCRGNGTGSRFMKQFLIPHLTINRHVTLECETRLVGWYSKLGANKLPVLDSIFAGRRFVFMYFESSMSSTALFNSADSVADNAATATIMSNNESHITAALAQKVMGELRVKFHDLHVMNTVNNGDDVYCTWE